MNLFLYPINIVVGKNIFDKMIVNFFKKLCNLQEKNLISMRGLRARNKRFMLDEMFYYVNII